MDYILNEMNQIEADGVDFVPFCEDFMDGKYELCQIIKSYTKEQWINGDGSFPKTPRLYWKNVDGKKKYCL